MRESYEQGLAHRSASNPTLAMATSRVWHGQEVHAGQVFSSEITTLAGPHCPDGGVTTCLTCGSNGGGEIIAAAMWWLYVTRMTW